MRCSMEFLVSSLLLLLRIASVSLGEAAEGLQKTPLQRLKDSPLRIVASLKNNNQKFPAMISGECRKKDAKQLQCNLVQNRFVPRQDGSYDLQVSIFRQTFRRSSDTAQWVSREGPAGMCGLVDVTTLEEDPELPDFVSTYSSLQIYTNRVGVLCKDLPNEEKETFLRQMGKNPLTVGSNKIDQMYVTFPPDF